MCVLKDLTYGLIHETFNNRCYLLAILCEHFVSKEVDIPQLEENNGVHIKLQIFWRIFVTHQTSESRKK